MNRAIRATWPLFQQLVLPKSQFCTAFAVAVIGSASLSAETISWSGGASGTWDQTNAGWSTATGDPWNAANGGSNAAEFNEASAAVTVSGDVFANGITFTQAATLSGGTINLAGTSPSISLPASSTIGSTLAGGSGVTISGAGRLTLNADASASLSGPVDLSAGRVRLGADNVLGTGSVDARNNGDAAAIWIGGGYTLDNDITLRGGSTFTYTNVALQVGYTGQGSGSGGTLGGTLTVDGYTTIGNDGSNPLVLNGSLSGSGTLDLTSRNGGTVTLNAASPNFTGTLRQNPSFNAYSIRLGHGDALENAGLYVKHRSLSFAADAGGIFNVGDLDGSLSFGLQDTANNPITLQVGGKNVASRTYSGAMSGPGSLVKQGTGTFTLTGGNSYSGGTTISGGTLQIGSGGTAGVLPGNATNNATLAFNRSDDVSYSGSITGSGDVRKLGSGALTLSGTSDYSGGTTVSAGTLVAASSSALGSGTATVAAGGRLRLAPAAIIANPVANLGAVDFLGTLEFAGGGLARTSTVGGSTQGTLLAGSADAAATLNPSISWLSQSPATASDIMRLTNTAGTAQVLSLTYDSGFAPDAAQDAYLGWFDTASDSWVNAIAGNVGGTGLFFAGSWNDYLAAFPSATPGSALGTYGHDASTSTVWAVVNHNSDFAVIIVPEPTGLTFLAIACCFAGLTCRRRPSAPPPA